MIKKGKDLMVFVDSGSGAKCVAYSTQCELDIDSEVTEVAGFNSGKWKEYIPGRCGWRVSTVQLLSDEALNRNDYIAILDEGKSVYLVFSTVGESADRRNPDSVVPDYAFARRGYAYISRLTYVGSNGNVATFQAEFVGSGKLDDMLLKGGIDNETMLENEDTVLTNYYKA